MKNIKVAVGMASEREETYDFSMQEIKSNT